MAWRAVDIEPLLAALQVLSGYCHGDLFNQFTVKESGVESVIVPQMPARHRMGDQLSRRKPIDEEGARILRLDFRLYPHVVMAPSDQQQRQCACSNIGPISPISPIAQ